MPNSIFANVCLEVPFPRSVNIQRGPNAWGKNMSQVGYAELEASLKHLNGLYNQLCGLELRDEV